MDFPMQRKQTKSTKMRIIISKFSRLCSCSVSSLVTRRMSGSSISEQNKEKEGIGSWTRRLPSRVPSTAQAPTFSLGESPRTGD